MTVKKTLDDTMISVTSGGKGVTASASDMKAALEVMGKIKKFDEAGFEIKDKTEEQAYKFAVLFNGRTTSSKENKDGIMETTYKLKLQGHDLPSAENGVTQKITIEFADLDWFKKTFGIEFDQTGQIEMMVKIGRINKTLNEFKEVSDGKEI